METSPLPVARTDGLLVADTDDETLVYDLERHRAHCLNRVAAIAWRLCDGKTSVERIAKAVAEATGTKPDADVVWYALRRLNGARLLARPLKPETPARTVSRRDLLRRLTAAGIGLMVLPTVATIIAPTSLQAQASCLPLGAPCTRGAGLPCCPGLGCGGPPGASTCR